MKPSRRLLIVDDYEPSRRALAVAFERRGYQCAAVGTEQDALTSIETFDPDVVILEWALKRESEHGLAARMRGRAARRLCIVVVSYANEPSGFTAREQVDAYLIKPALAEEIEAAVAQWSGHIIL